MFTGLIEEIGTVERVEKTGTGLRITVKAGRVLDGVRAGDSIAVDGACQTVTAFTAASFTVFASRVTASLTTLGSFAAGRPVNLERALTLTSRLGGHIVQGHVDGTGMVRALERDRDGLRVDVEVPPSLARYIAEKGSVAVDGVSLTVVALRDDRLITLYLIPETIGATTLTDKRAGDAVNIETDILAKYVERLLRRGDGGADDDRLMAKLAEGGFL